jgi:PBSX family phage terminase large subunit
MNKIKINSKLKPLFQEKTRYYIITGERGASKSFPVNIFLTLKLLQANQVVLFTRFTLISAKDSIIPEFKEKIELLNLEGKFEVNQHDIINSANDSHIMFRGIKTSHGDQTAKLKSLTGVNIWVLDEAEELTDENTFDKINMSVRSKTSNNMVILILNPAPKTHWIYKRYFLNRVPENFNGEKDGITYIHMSLPDNAMNIDPILMDELRKLKIENPNAYKKRVATQWMDEDNAIVFNYSKLKWFDTVDLKNAEIVAYCDVADQGKDFLCFVIGAIIGENIFIIDVVFTQDDSDITEPLIVSKFYQYDIQKAIFESNNQGLQFVKNIKKEFKRLDLENKESRNYEKRLIALPNSQNKHSRIILQQKNIFDSFYFKRSNDEMYNNYIEHLTTYTKDGKSDFDDAPDATAGLSKNIFGMIKNKK